MKILDISKENCPMTFIKTKLALEELPYGETLKVIVEKEDIFKNLISTFKENNFSIIYTEKEDNFYNIILKKP